MFAADLLSITATPGGAATSVQPVAPISHDAAEDSFAALVAKAGIATKDSAKAAGDSVDAEATMAAEKPVEPAQGETKAIPSLLGSVTKADLDSVIADEDKPAASTALQDASNDAAQTLMSATPVASLAIEPAVRAVDFAATGAPSFRQTDQLAAIQAALRAAAAAEAVDVDGAAQAAQTPSTADGQFGAPVIKTATGQQTPSAAAIETSADARIETAPPVAKSTVDAVTAPRVAANEPKIQQPSSVEAAPIPAPVAQQAKLSSAVSAGQATPEAPQASVGTTAPDTAAKSAPAAVSSTPPAAPDEALRPISDALPPDQDVATQATAPQAATTRAPKAQDQRATSGLLGAALLNVSVVSDDIVGVEAKTPPAANRAETSPPPSSTPQTATAQAAVVQNLAPFVTQVAAAPRIQRTTSTTEPLINAADGAEAASAEEASADTPDTPLQTLAPSRGARLDAETRAHAPNMMQARADASVTTSGSATVASAASADAVVANVPGDAQSSPATTTAQAPIVGSPAPIAPTAPDGAAPEMAALPSSSAEASSTTATSVRDHGLGGLSRATADTTAALAAQISRRLDARNTRFDMVLTPEGLGRVDVSLDIASDGRLSARLTFENANAANELKGRADELRRQLEDSGFQLSDDALNFSQRDPSSNGGFDRRRGQAFASASRIAVEAETAAAPAARWISSPQTPDGVDMKV